DDEALLTVADTAKQRRAREYRESDEEHPSPAEEVAEANGRQQDAAEGDEVGIDHPREARLAEREIALDGGQGDIHDRRVEDDHEHAGPEDGGGGPSAVPGVGGGGGRAAAGGYWMRGGRIHAVTGDFLRFHSAYYTGTVPG